MIYILYFDQQNENLTINYNENEDIQVYNYNSLDNDDNLCQLLYRLISSKDMQNKHIDTQLDFHSKNHNISYSDVLKKQSHFMHKHSNEIPESSFDFIYIKNDE